MAVYSRFVKMYAKIRKIDEEMLKCGEMWRGMSILRCYKGGEVIAPSAVDPRFARMTGMDIPLSY
jgi:hypothetical protein